ncbi:MAG: hypothetical protein A2W93_01380 [Bacteroidetes bacterium GWF2_43_63]|nr:MAG: hypothetical protein A2W94_10690 [Bacteroidetes bacterium GWE2_42_42]OFY55865.1 MAG: hypothetical protein A2W93_01380 [Bacteroidetes bacterium GWF2_43_63]
MQEPKSYVCYRTSEPVNIDGMPAEQAWSKAEWTDLFIDIEGDLKSKPAQNTQVKMLWDNDYLYILAELEEENIWAYLDKHDEVVYFDNDFEIFIDPDNDAKNYFEYEVNAKGTVFDLFLPHPYRHSSYALHNWDFKGIKQAIKIDGTLNDGSDKDLKWTIELAIPFTDLSFGLDSGKPNVDKPWRINFSRVEWDVKWENGKYIKLTNSDGKPLPEHNWVWSPVGAISMHMPERYGYLKFSDKIAGTERETFVLSENEKLKNVLWAVFYRESVYFEKNKSYTDKLGKLGNDIKSLYDNKKYNLRIAASNNTFEATLKSTDGKMRMFITQEGSVVEPN